MMKKFSKNQLAVFIALISSSALPAQVAVAAETLIEEVTVTAQKREQSLVEVPVALNLLSDAKLNAEYINTIDNLSRVAPSLNFNNDNIGIRGIGSAGFSVQVEPTVAVATDGVIMARSAQAFFNMIDVERVEVLRGPQGTLFGKNTSAGLVNIITKDPSREFESAAEVRAAEGSDYLFRGAVSGALSENSAGRLSGFFRNAAGFTELAGGGDRNDETAYAVRGKYQLKVGENLELKLTAYAQESEIDGYELVWREVNDPALRLIIDNLGVEAGPENNTASSSGTGRDDRSDRGLQMELDWQTASGHTLTSVTAASDWKMDKIDDVDEQPVALREPLYISPQPTPFGTLGPINFHQHNRQDIEQFSQELRLTSPEDGRFNYIAGLYAQHYQLRDGITREFDFCTYPALLGLPLPPAPPPLTPGASCQDPTFAVLSLSTASALMGLADLNGRPALTISALERDVQGENYALFGQGTYALSENLDFTLGLRYQYDETALDFDITLPNSIPGFGAVPAADTEDAVSGSGFSGKTSLQWRINDDAMLYASYARGYKGPTGDFRSSALAGLTPTDALIEIDPETSDNFELGLKTSLLDGRGYLAATLFHSDYTDYQAEQFSAVDQQFILANVGAVRSRGLELESQVQAGAHWHFDAALSYVDAAIEEYPAGKCYVPEITDPHCSAAPPFSKDLAGGDLPVSPKLKGHIAAQYEKALDSGLRTFARLSYSWQDDVQFGLDQNPRTVQEAYGLLNGSIGFGSADGGYTVSLYGRNLLDQNYATSMFQDFITGYSANIVQFRPKEAERQLGLALRMDF